jgi:hypothetical protein
MSTPILFGSPRAQKNYIRPKYEGLAPRTTPFGYNKDQSVERYVIPPPPPSIDDVFQGNSFGYVFGGNSPSAPASPPATPGFGNTIQKTSFVSDTTAVSSGELTKGVRETNGYSSGTDGYAGGGRNPTPFPPTVTEIWKFPFANESVSVFGNFSAPISAIGSVSAIGPANGYAVGGNNGISPGPPQSSNIEKFSFTSGGLATVIGTISPAFPVGRSQGHGMQSVTDGYHLGGTPGPSNKATKFPFSADTTTALISDMALTASDGSVAISETDGFITSAARAPSTTAILSINFATDTTAVNGDSLNNGAYKGTGTSSLLYGYSSGGYDPSPSFVFLDRISKYSYSNTADYSDVGTLSYQNAAAGPTGTQS